MNIIRVFDIYEGKIKDFAIKEPLVIESGVYVIIKNEEGIEEAAKCIRTFIVKDDFPVAKGEFLRKATANDMQKIDSLQEKNKRALEIFSDKIEQYNLGMRPISVQYSFNNKNIHFVFTAPERIDFRDLLKDLIASFRKKIFLEQIGPRDRAKLLGGYGKCGRRQCCTAFLQELPSVTMDAIREQHLMYKSSSKLLGGCGKLLCCLTYELDMYKELGKAFPSIGSIVKVGKERGEVIGIDILKQLVRIYFEKKGRIEPIPVQDVKIIEEKKEEAQIVIDDEKAFAENNK